MKKQGANSVRKTAVKKAVAPDARPQKRTANTAVKKKIEKALKRLHPMD
jgi:hypothetical protein